MERPPLGASLRMRRSQRQRGPPGWQREFDLTGGVVVERNDEPPGLLEVVESEEEEEDDDLEQDVNVEVVPNVNEQEGTVEDGGEEGDAALGRLHDGIGQPPIPGSPGAGDVGSQGTQNVPATQLPDITSLPSLEEAHNTYIPTHKWPPKSVRPELARTPTSLWQRLEWLVTLHSGLVGGG